MKNFRNIVNNKKSATAAKPLTKEQRQKKIIRRMWQIFGCFMGLIVLFFIFIYNGIVGYMPDVEELKNPADKVASIISTADGEEMGRFYRNTGNRV